MLFVGYSIFCDIDSEGSECVLRRLGDDGGLASGAISIAYSESARRVEHSSHSWEVYVSIIDNRLISYFSLGSSGDAIGIFLCWIVFCIAR